MTDPIDIQEHTTDGGSPSSLPRRYRIPSRYATWAIVLLAIVSGGVGSTGIVLAIIANKKTNEQADAAYLAQVESFETRRTNVFDTCITNEDEKSDLRQLIRSFGRVDPGEFPRSAISGRVILAPIGGDKTEACRARALKLVPESNRPKRRDSDDGRRDALPPTTTELQQ